MNDIIQFGEETNEIVYSVEECAVTNSLLVAEKFNKKHKHVLEAIRRIVSTAENSAVASMFTESVYINKQNKTQPMYIMNRDGFSLLAMGFTGKEAIDFKFEFISAFNKMESILTQQQGKQVSYPKTQAEIILAQAQQLVEQEKRMAAIESKQQAIEEKVSEIAARTKTDVQYSTIIGFASRFGISVPLEKASQLGVAASNICRSFGMDTGRTPDPRFGSVKTYPDSVLYDVFEKYYPSIRFR